MSGKLGEKDFFGFHRDGSGFDLEKVAQDVADQVKGVRRQKMLRRSCGANSFACLSIMMLDCQLKTAGGAKI